MHYASSALFAWPHPDELGVDTVEFYARTRRGKMFRQVARTLGAYTCTTIKHLPQFDWS